MQLLLHAHKFFGARGSEDINPNFAFKTTTVLEPKLSEFNYHLPEEKIAAYPLKERDKSKLLMYSKGEIKHSLFRNIGEFLPPSSVLVFNNTRVIHARLEFFRESGARIEIFCLKPLFPFPEVHKAMGVSGETTWECMVGNKKKWKANESLVLKTFLGDIEVLLQAEMVKDEGKTAHVRFSWEPLDYTMSKILEVFGKLPLPPYMNREAVAPDEISYQTVYATKEGAVAAPTAGLHFTPEILNGLRQQGHKELFVTLHINAGTFQPVTEENISLHPMHNEQMVFSYDAVRELQQNAENIIAVGTTSMRAVESLYCFGAMLAEQGIERDLPFIIEKLYPYGKSNLPYAENALQKVLDYMKFRHMDELWGQTSIFIMPGYHFKMVKGLITNFHLPGSTLLILIAAFTGNDWKNIYSAAMENDYRFLSYGDSSLLLR